MKETIQNKWQGVKGLMGRLTAQKKKTAVAVCLVLVMVFMWVRVLTPNVPDSAAAAVVDGAVGRSEPQLKMTYVELPVVKGRNDMLARDFFTVGKGFLRGGGGLDIVLGGGSEEMSRRIAKKLRLEAIVSGKNPQAFINDKLVSVGDKLVVKEGATEYEFVVVKIGQSAVSVRCGEAEVTLKLAPAIEGVD